MSTVYTIQTPRLIIRCYQPGDAFMLKEAIDASIEHLLPWMPWAEEEPEEVDVKIERIRKWRGEFDLGKNFIYGIFDKENTRLIGGTGLHPRIGPDAREIGYWVRAEEIGKGYASETARALIKVAFEVDRVERVEIRCNLGNERSAAIPKKLGFRNEAVVRTNQSGKNGERIRHMIWMLFKEEYQQSQLCQFPVEMFDVAGRKVSG